MKDIVLGFSGGTDSYTATRLLQDAGYRVHALTLDMIGDVEMVDKARKLAEKLGVQFTCLNIQELFKKEIEEYFINEYLAGRTPAPCTRCNPQIKWRTLEKFADSLGIEHIATGHYFRIEEHRGKHFIAKAKDPRKDQSYYLWGINPSILPQIVTPMADIIKEDIKSDSPIKGESMGVCFLRGARYGDFIAQKVGAMPSGEIVNSVGDVVGAHSGVANYTIGQKRGDGIPPAQSVINIDTEKNQIIVGGQEDLLHKHLIINNVNIFDEEELINSDDIRAIVRGIGRNPEGFAKVRRMDDNKYEITLEQPAWAAALGQPVVLYRGDRVLGGGYLCEIKK